MKTIFAFLLVALCCRAAQARVEYAVRNGFVSCMQCHVSPAGAGIRNMGGKLYGFKNYEANPLSQSELYQADIRSAFMHTSSEKLPSRRGFMVMSTNGAVSLPIVKSDEGWSMGFVGSYGFGMLESGLRDSYAIFTAPGGKGLVDAVLVGRTKPAFGLATDEHRTYVRLQSRTTYALRDFETGVMVSGTPFYSFHYDLMFTSGEKTLAGSGGSSGSSTSPWGLYANLRMIPFHGPLTLGASYNQQGNQNLNYDAEAMSVSAGVALEKMTFGLLPGVFLVEGARAHGWNNQTMNPSLASTFGAAAQAGWFTAFADAWSEALLAQLSLDLTQHLTALGKAEQFTPDVGYPGDSFFRYGGGLRWYMNSNANLQLMYESSYSSRAGLNSSSGVPAVENFTYALLHLWL